MKVEAKDSLNRVLQLDPKFWKSIGGDIQREVRRDARDGLFQNDRKKLRYRSRQYTKYKANDMRRFTDKKRLKEYYARPISSDHIAYVNMTLTGKTLKGLKIEKATSTGVTMGFNPSWRAFSTISSFSLPGLSQSSSHPF